MELPFSPVMSVNVDSVFSRKHTIKIWRITSRRDRHSARSRADRQPQPPATTPQKQRCGCSENIALYCAKNAWTSDPTQSTTFLDNRSRPLRARSARTIRAKLACKCRWDGSASRMKLLQRRSIPLRREPFVPARS